MYKFWGCIEILLGMLMILFIPFAAMSQTGSDPSKAGQFAGFYYLTILGLMTLGAFTFVGSKIGIFLTYTLLSGLSIFTIWELFQKF